MTISKEELQELFKGFREDVLGTVKQEMESTVERVNKANGGLAASLTKDFKKQLKDIQGLADESSLAPSSPEPTPSREQEIPKSNSDRLTLKALKQEIESLRKDNELKESKLSISNRDSVLAKTLEARNVNFKDKALKGYLLEYGDSLKKEGDTWFVSRGDDVVSINDSVEEFLSSDFGTSFLPPTKGRGLGMKSATGQPPSKDAKPTLNQTLFAVEE